MEVTSVPMTEEDLFTIDNCLEKSERRIRKVAMYLFGFAAVLLFIPADILKLLSRRTSRYHVSGMLFNELGPSNAVIFIVIPIVLLLAWFYFIGVHKLKKDRENKMKDVGLIRVSKIEPMSEQHKKDVFGLADHIIHFEKNPFGITSTHFLAAKQPELMQAKQYRVEVATFSKVEFKREIV